MIHFVRHGQTAHNRDGLLQGRVDVALSEIGRMQAERVANRYVGSTIAAVVTSPLRRARDTAAAIAAVTGCKVEIDDRLLELDYGEWDGRALTEIPGERWAEWIADPNFAPPGGESLVAVTARVVSFCRDHLLPDDRHVVAVSHVSPIKAAVAWALGADERVTFRMHLGLASITKIGTRSDGSGYLASFNDGAHLEGE
jgi:broad specificity phosphatase PhoE